MSGKKNNLHLPEAYIQFLDSKEELDLKGLEDYDDVEDIKPLSLNKLKVEVLKYTNYLLENFFEDCEPDQDKGYYPIEYIDLLDDDGRNLLVWYPHLQCFGQFDSEHGAIYAYKDVPWEKIKNKPEAFLSGIYEHNIEEKYELDPRKEKSLEFVVTKKYQPYAGRGKITLQEKILYNPGDNKILFILSEKSDEETDAPVVVLTNQHYEVEYTLINGERKYQPDKRVVVIDRDTGKPKKLKSSDSLSASWHRFVIAPLNERDPDLTRLKQYFLLSSFGEKETNCHFMMNYLRKRMKTDQVKMTLYNTWDFMGIGENHRENEEMLFKLNFGMRETDPKNGITRIYVLKSIDGNTVCHAGTDKFNNIFRLAINEEYVIGGFSWYVIAPYNNEEDYYSITPELLKINQRVVVAWKNNEDATMVIRFFEPEVQFVVVHVEQSEYET